MIGVLRGIADHLEVDGVRHLVLIVAAMVAILGIAVLVWLLYWTWMFQFFGN